MRFFLFSLGCKVNGYENSALRESFLEKAIEEVSHVEEADLIIINTCSVTSTADQKSRQHIRKFRKLSPNSIIVVMGCYSELHAKDCLTFGASIVLGTAERKRILEFVEAYKKDHKPIMEVHSVRHESFEELGLLSLSEQARAYLKIQDGCDNFCSYCLIPTLRGNSRSRDKNNVLLEAKKMVEKGYKEIVIAGIHIGAYGKDLGDGSYRLSSLLKDILDENPSLFRLRVSSLEESEIDDKFLSLLKDYPNLASHLHLPLQSGSSSVLKRMHRPYDTSSFLTTLKKIREVRPNIAITTDVIVGFPGESEEEWNETKAFCSEAKFAEIHVFPFSARGGTLAASMKGQIDPRIKEKRVQELLSLSKALREEYEKSCFLKSYEVLYEDYDAKESLSYGHTGNYLLVKTPSLAKRHGEVEKVIYTKENRAD